MGSATVTVAVFGVAPKTRQTDLSNAVSAATPETTRETRALPQNVQRKIILAAAFVPSAVGATYL
jgi:hypothetical protein